MTIAFLADHPECRDTLAEWYLREWPNLFDAMEHARRIGISTLHLWTPGHRGFYEKLGWQFVRDYQHDSHSVAILRFPFPQNPD